MNTGITYEEHVARVRSDAARFLRAAGVNDLMEVPKPRNRLDVGDRPLSASGAFILDSTRAVQGWFSVTFGGRQIPVTVVQRFTRQGTWDTTILGVDRVDCPSDHVFVDRVREALRREAGRTPV